MRLARRRTEQGRAHEVRRTLVLGGARSGKSAEAERRVAPLSGVTYVATAAARADDPEWAQRIDLHRRRRPADWRTLETTDLVPLLTGADGPLLIDCLTLWLTAVMDAANAWDDAAWRSGAEQAVAARSGELAEAWRDTAVPVVAVSSEVGLGVVPETAAGRRFRDELGRLNERIAAASDQVLLVVAGQTVRIR